MKNTTRTLWAKIYQFLNIQCKHLFFSTKMRSRISLVVLVLIIVTLILYWSYVFFLYMQNKANNELDCQSTWNQIKEIWEASDKKWFYVIKNGKVYWRDYEWSTLNYTLISTDIDLDTFRIMSSWYSRDANHIYFWWKRIKNAGYCSFEVLIFENGFGMSEWFARDAKHVYRFWKIMEGVDAATFERVNSFYFKDKNHIYHRSWKIVDQIDPNAFY